MGDGFAAVLTLGAQGYKSTLLAMRLDAAGNPV
jgi:hypothetical protein